jgi:hypothetical protein
MLGFPELFSDGPTLVALVVIITVCAAYGAGTDYGDTLLIGGLGMVKMVPATLLKGVAASFPLLAPLCAVAFLWYMGQMRVLFGGAMAMLMTVCFVLLLVGV